MIAFRCVPVLKRLLMGEKARRLHWEMVIGGMERCQDPSSGMTCLRQRLIEREIGSVIAIGVVHED